MGWGQNRRPLATLALSLAGSLAAAAAAGAQTDPCTPPATDTGFSEITVNVKAGTFDKVLPFDVPIRLCGTAPAGTEWVRVQAAAVAPKRGRRAAGGDQALLGSPVPVEVEAQTCRIAAPAGASWQPDPPLDARIDSSTNTFRVVLPRLEAQRYYAFCFLLAARLTEEQARAFLPVARQTLDLGLRPVRTGDLSSEDSARLRAALGDALLASTAADQMITPGTLFDPALPQDRVRGEFNRLVRGALEPQLQRQAVLEGRPAAAGAPAAASWASLQFDLRRSLDAIRSDPSLARLLAVLEPASEANPNLETLLEQEFAAGLALARLNDEQAARVAQGADPAAEEATTLLDSWDPAAAGAVASRYDATSQALGNLGELIGKMTAADAPAEVRGALAPAEATGLAALAADGGPLTRAGDLCFTLSGLASGVQASLEARSLALDALAAEVALASREVQVADGSTTGSFDTFKNFYVSADAGLVWAPEVDEVVSYVGTNLYLRPVNKNAPLRTLGGFGETFGRRFAFTLALTVQSLADSENGEATRDDLFGKQSLLVGVGLRITDMIRFGAGALVFKRQDPDPLVDELEVAVSYYLTVSFDLDVASAFKGGLGGLFGGT